MDHQPPAIVQTEETTYSKVYARINKGETLWVTFGLFQIPGWAPKGTLKSFDHIPNFNPGLYKLWKDEKTGLPTAQQYLESNCQNGVCKIKP